MPSSIIGIYCQQWCWRIRLHSCSDKRLIIFHRWVEYPTQDQEQLLTTDNDIITQGCLTPRLANSIHLSYFKIVEQVSSDYCIIVIQTIDQLIINLSRQFLVISACWHVICGSERQPFWHNIIWLGLHSHQFTHQNWILWASTHGHGLDIPD